MEKGRCKVSREDNLKFKLLLSEFVKYRILYFDLRFKERGYSSFITLHGVT